MFIEDDDEYDLKSMIRDHDIFEAKKREAGISNVETRFIDM